MRPNREALAILQELDNRVVPKSTVPKPGETRSVGTIQKIIRRKNEQGEDGGAHARLVLMLINESENNKASLCEATIGAVSDLLDEFRAMFPQKAENGISEFFDFLDRVPLPQIRTMFVGDCKDKRASMKGMLRERMIRFFGMPQMDLLDDRRLASHPENAKV